MMDESPFRERPKFLLCPRCGEMLDRAFDAVLVCLRCEGVWIAPVSLEKAFGSPKWPVAQSMWWRNSLECPECAAQGVAMVMDAAMSGHVLIDRCTSHGVWLDRGELGRLMGGATDDDAGDDDLEALRGKLAAVDADLEGLIGRREAWRADVDARRRAASEYRSWLQTEERRRADLAKERERERELERQQTLLLAAAQRERREQELAAEKLRDLAGREREQVIQRLGDARVQTSSEVARIESQIIMMRAELRSTEALLDGARARLRAIDDQLEVLQR